MKVSEMRVGRLYTLDGKLVRLDAIGEEVSNAKLVNGKYSSRGIFCFVDADTHEPLPPMRSVRRVRAAPNMEAGS